MGLFSARCTSDARLDGKTAIVTGSNTGIGKCTVKDFYVRGARVIMACRNVEKAEQAANDIKEDCKQKNVGTIVVTALDLTSLKSVRNCANHLLKTENRIDLLVNNAGVMMCPESKTEDGFETQFQSNHLGHFLFTLLLLPKLVQNTPARIVNVSSMLHEGIVDFDDLNWTTRKYSALGAYHQSKLANILFTKELARRIKDNKINGVSAYALHPGVIRTELSRHLNPVLGFVWNNIVAYFLKTPEQGAQTTIYCAVDEKCANETGLYYAECALKEPSQNARNAEDAKKLWDISLKLVGLDDNYDPFKYKL